MIVIDTDMPTKCMNCQLLGRDMIYCQVYPRKDLNVMGVASGRPEWCPIKCDIEDIKAEIEASRYGLVNDGLDLALKIIDKHISGKE